MRIRLSISFDRGVNNYIRDFNSVDSADIDVRDVVKHGRLSDSFQWEYGDLAGIGITKKTDEMTCYLVFMDGCQYVYPEYIFSRGGESIPVILTPVFNMEIG